MDTTQKVLIGLIVILGAVLLVTNLNRITGQVQLSGAGAGAEEYVPETVASTTEITVQPTIVNPGDELTINVKIGNQGSRGAVEIYSAVENSARLADIKLSGCSDECTPSDGRTETANYKAGLDWTAGEYYASIIDTGSNEKVKAYFTII